MSVQAAQVTDPFDALADAHAAYRDAVRRHDDSDDDLDRAVCLAAADQAAADVAWLRERIGLEGGLSLHLAAEHAPKAVYGVLNRLYGEVVAAAVDTAKLACGLADRLRQDVDALKQEVKRLEKRIDDLTPGVGEPGVGR